MMRDQGKTLNSLDSPLPDNGIRALVVDTKGNLWIGTKNGLAEFNDEGILLCLITVGITPIEDNEGDLTRGEK